MNERSGPRATVDTNLFVSGVISPGGSPRRLLRAWYGGRFHLLLSDEQLAELTGVLGRPKIVAKYPVTPEELAELFAGLDSAERVARLPTLPVPLRDPKDVHILAAALGGAADYLVTGDEDLLTLAGDPRLGTLKIVTVAEFLALLDKA